MSERVCPNCGSTNTGALVNDVNWVSVWVTRSSARQERHILAGCGCRDCGVLWEAWDTPRSVGKPFNIRYRCSCEGGTLHSTGDYTEHWIDSEPHGEWHERLEVFQCDKCENVDMFYTEKFFVPDTSHDEYKDRP